MPWASIEIPSLALGILRRVVREKIDDADAEVVHANIDYVDWVNTRLGHGLDEYFFYAKDSYFLGCGDWVFSSALYDDPAWRADEFSAYMAEKLTPAELTLSHTLHGLAAEYIDWQVSRILAMAPDIVGFTTTFQQNTAALAAAKRIKQLTSQVVTVFGGANCDGEQGAAIHRGFEFVDIVVRGEAEVTFPQVVRALSAGSPLAGVDGVCWRSDDGQSVANTMAARPLPPGEIVRPDYDGYFERLAASCGRNWVEPKLVVESARGCWWGEKHHCTFCGLNGSAMQFRSKSPLAFFDEITELARRHQTLDMMVVDNILDMTYLDSLMPKLADAGYDFRLHYEIKANLRHDQLKKLADAGVVQVQPGIESFNSRVLGLMDKGTTGCLNVRVLRDARSTGVTAIWNYLYGFPGETEEDYSDVLDQVRALYHLAPPSPEASRIAIERFSPYFNQPELGFAELRPAAHFALIYDLPEKELFDLVYLFDAPGMGVGDEIGAALTSAAQEWAQCHVTSRFTYCDLPDRVVLVNTRPHFDWRTICLEDPVDLAVFRLLDQPRTVASLERRLRDRADLRTVTRTEIADLMQRWRGLGILFEDCGRFVQVASEATNDELLHVRSTASVTKSGILPQST
jgi:ribosomal peptide maturation radical SAM protein 1